MLGLRFITQGWCMTCDVSDAVATSKTYAKACIFRQLLILTLLLVLLMGEGRSIIS